MRVEGSGRVDRSKVVKFSFDGQAMTGFVGDTLASALMANDVTLLARSFKYHRPRGVLTAGSEEPNALVTIGAGAARDPNVRATTQELYDGLSAQSQNRWPSLEWDLLSINALAKPFLGAGFYYKTFMWPKAFWERVYEPVIRRAAGLGALSGRANDDVYEKAYAFCDLLVVGAGPTGLMAALVAARGGADVILCDEGAEMGGRLLAEQEQVGGQPGSDWVADVVAELSAMENVRLMARTTITGAYDQRTYGALERVAQHRADRTGLPLECFWRIVARRTVLAAGALERGVAFGENDRPGILMAGAMRAYLNRWGVVPGQRVAVFGNNDDAHRTAWDLARAGIEVVGLVDSRIDAASGGDFPVFAGAVVSRTHGGRQGITGITIKTPQGQRRLAVDALAMSGGWNPSVHLTCHMNGRPVWDEAIAGFVPRPGAVPGLVAAGACAGIFSTHSCLMAGIEAGQGALSDLGRKPVDILPPEAEDAPYRLQPLWQVPGKVAAWLDFQNDVTVADVMQAAAENFRSVEHMKRYTTQGMATDQGKSSNVAALAVLADVTGRSVPETGTTTFRPPFVPVSIAAIGAGSQGMGFAPQRLTTSHAGSVVRGAPMIEAGLWYRPSHFPRAQEITWREACDREVAMVRNAVGVCDVSTLGKIDLQGPDAGKFLDLVYTNTFSTLKVGRVRYGLMLREDGHVMDDGTTARLGTDHFVMTTTTAAAGPVMKHLEFVHQTHVPGMDLRMISVTEHWAQFAIAGPKSRELLNGLLAEPVDDAGWPFMACGVATVLGVAGRLFRISFSGEHAYEVAVPARYGAALFQELVARAEAIGGGAYGMEALNVLRIEKGHITHAEIHGRTTAFDIGMGRMVSAKKDCIGKVMSERPGLTGVRRQQMVGLRPVADGTVTAGAHLFAEGANVARETDEGYVTSVCWSPTLDCWLALGFLRDGRARIGQRVRLLDALRGVDTLCEVTDPMAYDQSGGRMRG
ncbi:sarcosine oxidase subunit alpha family protein [Puniceibacterium sp. IMCC21224]|uniref:sarcosine oxidase subunit alpha family protein n=1 Tax=Puniceibacterium sp. IMCC21224 TaxID=1618204 RepID=UPI00064DAE2A|nr:sarcosine oxidase subunit alpha family protein [Puniceibacterium sp. IMCC21224]KMK66478.1 sarcosine oxidase, alpha subunit family, heterotetrameric form [Puniceibacterium sp. IMCC21224]